MSIKTLLTRILNWIGLVDDYIVERGSDGLWTYRKWDSGIAECWGYISATSTSLSTSYGSLYYGSQKTQAFPSGLFVDFPKFINVQAYDNGNGTQASVSTWTKDDASWYPYGLYNTTINVGYTVEAKGRWK